MTITLAAVYAPIAFQGGLTGSLFPESALTLAGAVCISGVVALTLSPVMSSKLLSAERENHGLAGSIAALTLAQDLQPRAFNATLPRGRWFTSSGSA
jgi:multidrug efflux pump subunit AcrB